MRSARCSRNAELLRNSLCATFVCAMLSSVQQAQAADANSHVRSNALFDDGKRQLAEGRVAAACESFSQSQQLEPRGGTLLNLGLCHEQQGLLLRARRELIEALAMARRDARADREPLASQHIAAIEARLAWLAIAAPGNASAQAITVKVDGAAIAREARAAVPVEAGEHTVSVEAPGFEVLQVKLVVGAGEKLVVALPALRARVPEPAAPPAAVALHTAHVEPDAAAFAMPRTLALVVGLVGIAASVATGALALGQKAVVAAHCDAQKRCDPRGLDAATTGRALTLVSDIALVTGAVGLTAWVVLPGGVLNPERPPERSVGMLVRGVF